MERTNTKGRRGLRWWRERKGLSQQALESTSGVLQRSISRMESAPPSRALVNAIRVARALGVSVEELFGEAVPAERTPGHTRRRPVVHTAND